MRKPDDFNELYTPIPESGCFIWIGQITTSGYGLYRNRLAHRVAFSREKGPIPPGFDVCHNCDTKLCVNAKHLFLGTRLENMKDCVDKGRQSRGSNRPTSKLREEDIPKIRRDTRPGLEIAADYGISKVTVCQIKKRKRWGHVPD